MKRTTLLLLLLFCFLNSLIPAPAMQSGQSPETNQGVAFVGAKIYTSPTDKPILDGVVLVKDGKITGVGNKSSIKIPGDTRVIDCSGLTLTAGFWNSHVHFTEPKWQNAKSITAQQLAQSMGEMITRYGFVHVIDTGSDLQNTLAIKQRIEKGETPGPSIRTAGMPFVPQNGTPFYVAPLKLPELATPAEAAKRVGEQIAAGADLIKLFAASPVSRGKPPVVMPRAIAHAAVSAAHALGKPVIAHPTSEAGVRVALESGVDILAHTTPDGMEPWGDELVRSLRAKNVALAPTLKLWEWEAERAGASQTVLEKFIGIAQQQLRAYAQAGGEILFGTDLGYVTDYDTTDEYVLMSGAGMTFQQILAALTVSPAKRFGLANHTGRIAVGMDADIVILNGDPAVDIKAFSNVRFTLRKGKILYERKRP